MKNQYKVGQLIFIGNGKHWAIIDGIYFYQYGDKKAHNVLTIHYNPPHHVPDWYDFDSFELGSVDEKSTRIICL